MEDKETNAKIAVVVIFANMVKLNTIAKFARIFAKIIFQKRSQLFYQPKKNLETVILLSINI
jgi:hypothetical protein